MDKTTEQKPGGRRIVREIRINPVVPSESVLVATARSMRPKKEEAPPAHDSRPHVETCPFCRGNEAMTPSPIAEVPPGKVWSLRIVENLFPVLGSDCENPNFAFGLQQTIDGYGRHEVVIDHADHGIRLHEMSEEHLALLLAACRTRMDQLYHADERLKYVLVFKNSGHAAGASIPHTHSQIIAMPVVPDNVQAEVRGSMAFYQESRQCIFCRLVDEALTFEATIYDRESGEVRRRISVGQLVIERTERFIAVKPFASRYEWEVHILPLAHQADYLDAGDRDFADLGRLLRRTMARLQSVLNSVQYNFFLHSVPHGDAYEGCGPAYHWHLEICPRTSIPTGFELGSGLFVNTICPEEAAERLRSVRLPEDGPAMPASSATGASG